MENKQSSEALSMGKLLGFFFNILGLFGCFIYPQGSEEREKFILGWKSGFIAFLIIGGTILGVSLLGLISLS